MVENADIQSIGLIAGILAASIAVGWVLSWVLLKLFGRFFRPWNATAELAPIIHTALRPLAAVLGLMFTRMLLPFVKAPDAWQQYLQFGIDGLAILCSILIVLRLSDVLWFRLHQRAAQTESPVDDALVPLVEKAAKFLIVLFGLVVLLQSWNFNVTAILAGVSIGGIAFAFAAQSTIANLFGSAMIFVDRPFQIGDWIKVDGNDGTVEAIGFRSTRIRTFANSVISIPNGKLADMAVDNMGLRRMRRYQTTLGIQYDTPPDRVDAFVKALRVAIEHHPSTLKDTTQSMVFFHGFDASSLNVLVNTYFEVTNWHDELKARHELNLAFMKAAADCGVEFAFPTRTVHIASSTPQHHHGTSH